MDPYYKLSDIEFNNFERQVDSVTDCYLYTFIFIISKRLYIRYIYVKIAGIYVVFHATMFFSSTDSWARRS